MQPEKICRLQSTNLHGVRSAKRTDLCFAICRFIQVVFIASCTISFSVSNSFWYFLHERQTDFYQYSLPTSLQKPNMVERAACPPPPSPSLSISLSRPQSLSLFFISLSLSLSISFLRPDQLRLDSWLQLWLRRHYWIELYSVAVPNGPHSPST